MVRLSRAIVKRIDALWGYDVFVAHRRIDGAEYAQALHDQLTEGKVRCFIDKNVYKPGDYLPAITQRHVAKSTMLVVVASPGLLETRCPDWVQTEIEFYRINHHDDPKVLVIDFAATVASNPDHPIAAELAAFLREMAEKGDLQRAPAPSIVKAVKDQLGRRRVERVRLQWFQGFAAVLFVLAVSICIATYNAYKQRKEAQARTGQALGARALQLLEQPVTRETAADVPALAVQGWALSRNADAWNALQRLPWAGAAVPLGNYGPITSFDVSPDNSLVALGAKDALRIFSKEGIEKPNIKHDGWVDVVTFSPDGRLLATGSGGLVRVFQSKDSIEVPGDTYKFKGPMLGVAFNQNGRFLAAVAGDGTVRLTRMDDRTSETVLDPGVGVRRIAFTPEGELLAVARVDGSLWVCDLKTKEKYRVFFKPNTDISALAFGRYSAKIREISDIVTTGARMQRSHIL